jgi:hypothetical protein
MIKSANMSIAWMRLQISYTQKCDPFDATRRFIRIMPTNPMWSDFQGEYNYPIKENLPLLFIDESQIALRISLEFCRTIELSKPNNRFSRHQAK